MNETLRENASQHDSAFKYLGLCTVMHHVYKNTDGTQWCPQKIETNEKETIIM